MRFGAISGGIGCGKSTVASLLAECGATVIDVDLLSRELQQPGMPTYEAMVKRWGDAIVAPDGRIDRAAVAAIVFNDKAQLGELHAMTDRLIEEAIYARVAVHHDTDRVVLLESALLPPDARNYGIKGAIVVDAQPEVAMSRLLARGLDAADAAARMARQLGRDERLARAELVIDNSGSLAQLRAQIPAAWAWLQQLPHGYVERRL